MKVTHLPPNITKEKLYLHFRKAGEIDGNPILHETPTSKYAHVNFYDPVSAERAVNLRKIDNFSITVKLVKRPGNQIPAEVPKLDPDRYDKIMKLDGQQWNSLMLVNTGGTSQFQEIMALFKSNPNVNITPLYDEMKIKFAGTFDAVECAYGFLQTSLKKEINFDK